MTSIDITPPNKIYGTFARLNYKPWYAVAEFVDNATQNFFEHAQEIADADGQALLDINLSYSPSSNDLLIRDNANGMDLDELTRAMKISTPPPDTSGRSEFGLDLVVFNDATLRSVDEEHPTRLQPPFAHDAGGVDVENT